MEDALKKNIKEIIKEECRTLGLDYYDEEEPSGVKTRSTTKYAEKTTSSEADELEKMKRDIQSRKQQNQADREARHMNS